ncbi:hypothetical protein ACKWTF_005296 [Chironomus riparius]
MIFGYYLLLLFILNGLNALDLNPTSKNLTVPENLEDFLSKYVKKEKSQSKSPKLQISSGRRAYDTQFPYVADLIIVDGATGARTLCSASLIATNWLLTAKNCIPSNIKSILAIFGSADRQSSTKTRIFVNHVSFAGAPDVALLRLEKSVTLSSTIKLIRLPGIPKENFGYDLYDITAIGWGATSSGVSRYLQFANFKILPKIRCNFSPYTFCSFTYNGGSSLKAGDFGGPAVIIDSDGIETLVGINAATSATNEGVYQIMTRVSSLLRWIQLTTGVVYQPDSMVVPKGYQSNCISPGSSLFSASGCYGLLFQTDGNVVIYSKAKAVIWATNTSGKKATNFCIQSDGNLVLYNGLTPVWNSGTNMYPGAYAKLQADASFAIFKAGTTTSPVWRSKALTTFPNQC